MKFSNEDRACVVNTSSEIDGTLVRIAGFLAASNAEDPVSYIIERVDGGLFEVAYREEWNYVKSLLLSEHCLEKAL